MEKSNLIDEHAPNSELVPLRQVWLIIQPASSSKV